MTEEKGWLEKNIEELIGLIVIGGTMAIAMYQTVMIGDIRIPVEIIGLDTLILGSMFRKMAQG